ncbi:tRNA (guanine-N1)-methyltransferase [Candidatus Tenderia electrophaga]|uniref:tRNA (guanine-N(1)-)-methyltransferase n=1 Tax=Candidatus Tenderia electrophaga TaxID=1748243 RepID=A0A0S2TBS6_9GAMM|nr:tRNA (guanine-N1)-methyltransferase [Candidatus Tenderia electrophaga]
MRIDVVTLFPQLIADLARYGVTGRALQGGVFELGVWNPRDYTQDRHRTVDDRPYGGGPGMVMMIEPLRQAIQAARRANPAAGVVYLSPQGRRFDQGLARDVARRPGLILVAGRYEGVDERVLELDVDEEWSIGDYVLSGGETAALVVVDAVTRLLPGALGHEDSAQQDSFSDGLLDCPHYTRPENYQGRPVPAVLLSGDHGAIRRWRLKQSLGRTWLRRAELLQGLELDKGQQMLLEEFIREHEEQQD